MRAISIAGFKNSGKTTLTSLLAAALERRGLSVSIAKRTHHRLDKPDTDTAKLCAPGRIVAGFSETETALFWGGARQLPDMLPLLQADILLVEGGKSRDWLPRVLCARDPSEGEALNRGLALASYGRVPVPGLPHFTESTIDDLAALAAERAFMLPGLDCGACGYEGCLGLARAIVAGAAAVGDCRALDAPTAVTINGQPLGLNPFTAKVLGGAIRGMLREMKGVAPGDVEIRLKLQDG